MTYWLDQKQSVSAPRYGIVDTAHYPLRHDDGVEGTFEESTFDVSMATTKLRLAEPGTYSAEEMANHLAYLQLTAGEIARALIEDCEEQFAKDHPSPTRWEQRRHEGIIAHMENVRKANHIAYYHAHAAVREAQMQGCEPPSRQARRITDDQGQ